MNPLLIAIWITAVFSMALPLMMSQDNNPCGWPRSCRTFTISFEFTPQGDE